MYWRGRIPPQDESVGGGEQAAGEEEKLVLEEIVCLEARGGSVDVVDLTATAAVSYPYPYR
jgi:hypothetical protein